METASCIENIAEIAAVPGVDILFLGQTDHPACHWDFTTNTSSPHTHVHIAGARCCDKEADPSMRDKRTTLFSGYFCLGRRALASSQKRASRSSAWEDDLHHLVTQVGAYVNDVEKVSQEKGKAWKRRPTALF